MEGVGRQRGLRNWYALYRTRSLHIDAVAAQSDDLAMGARAASERLSHAGHRTMFAQARFFGIDACPNYGQRLVDAGRLTGRVMTTVHTGAALRALTSPTPYPPSSAPA